MQSQFSLIRTWNEIPGTNIESLFRRILHFLFIERDRLNNQSKDFVKRVFPVSGLNYEDKEKNSTRKKSVENPSPPREKRNKRIEAGANTQYRQRSLGKRRSPTLTPSCTLVKRFFRQPMVAPERVGQASRISLSRVKTHDSVQVK